MDYRYVPFYMQGNAITGIYYGQWGMSEDRDIDYVKEMYPMTFSKIQEVVEQECDRQEFTGSMMFDEYPDRYSVTALCRKIYREITGEKELQGTACEKDRLYQLIEVMLVHEMFRRRCRYRRCRRWYY